MTFSTEKNKLFQLWNNIEENRDIIITQKRNNSFIIDNINKLNRLNSNFPILKNFSTDWINPSILTFENGNIKGNFQEFKLQFNTINPNFIPYIHSEIIYRVGLSGVIPITNENIPFDEEIANSNRLQKNEIFQIKETSIEYITYIRMDFLSNKSQEIQYKFITYILNPTYYQTT